MQKRSSGGLGAGAQIEFESLDFRLILDQVGEAIYVHDAHTLRILYANRHGCECLGYSLEEITNLAASDIEVGYPLYPDSDEWKALLVKLKSTREIYRGDGLNRRKDGSVFPVTVSAVYEVFQGREAVVTVIRDVSQLREQQAKLVAASKMASLGEMSSGIAHEINNPLTVILASTEVLEDAAREGELEPGMVGRLAGRIALTARRISRIVTGLRAFAREAENDPFESVSVARLFAETLDLCAVRFASQGVDLRVARVPESIAVSGRPSQLVQVLLNLLNNAFDAVEPLPERWVEVGCGERGGWVEISVTDSGKGIAPEVAEKILFPFFTTKDVGKGTGLGLSIANGIVQSHGGALELDRSCPNTRFVVKLPSAMSARRAA